jgi:Na+-driven multidrug efflux pump
MIKSAAILLGLVFLAIGILGFIPGATTNEMLFGTFHVNAIHSIVHIVSGVIALLCGLGSRTASRAFFQVFGVLYAIIAILGFYYGEQPIFRLISNNRPDIWLHVVLAVVMLFLGFGTARQTAS